MMMKVMVVVVVDGSIGTVRTVTQVFVILCLCVSELAGTHI